MDFKNIFLKQGRLNAERMSALIVFHTWNNYIHQTFSRCDVLKIVRVSTPLSQEAMWKGTRHLYLVTNYLEKTIFRITGKLPDTRYQKFSFTDSVRTSTFIGWLGSYD